MGVPELGMDGVCMVAERWGGEGMSEMQRIVEQLQRAFDGHAWHGPAVREVLAGMTAADAAARPLQQAHSIWDIVLHIAAWENVVRRRLQGEVIDDLPSEDDWPGMREASEEAWRLTVQRLEQGNRALRDAITQQDEARLEEMVPGKGYSVYTMLHGIIQHDLYHAGQIAVLKKALSGALDPSLLS
jgi:uncharacterized damage-inducible protein DinB